MRARLALVLLAITVLTPACSDEQPGPRPTVVVSFFPLAEVAHALLGADADVIDLTPAGRNPHGLTELATSDVARADVLVHLSRGFQPAVDELAGSFRGWVVDGLQGLSVVDDDVHVWLDPTYLAPIVSAVRVALTEVDPDRADEYAANARRYQRALAVLDRRLTRGLANCERNVVVPAHAAWRYFTSRYRLEQEPLAGVSAGEPTAGRAEELAALVRDAGVTTVFREPSVPDGPIAALAHATGAEVATLDPIEASGGTYARRMAGNLAAIRTALDCT
jgi:zinc transport system substrate-binding protein